MRSIKLKLKKHLSSFVAFLVFANTLGTGRAFAAGVPIGTAGTQAAVTGSVDGVSYTVAAENSTGIVKSDGTIVTSLGDSEIGYNYKIEKYEGNVLAACVTLSDVSTFDELKQAMNNAPAEVAGVTAGSATIDVPVLLFVTLSDDIEVTEELACKAWACIISGAGNTISRSSDYKGC